MTNETSVRRQWVSWRVPLLWRKMQKRRSPSTGAPAYRYTGGPDGVNSFLDGILDQELGMSPTWGVLESNPVAYWDGRAIEGFLDGSDAASGWGEGWASGGGSGGFGDIFSDVDEVGAIIALVCLVAVVALIFLPLGFLALEVVLGILGALGAIALSAAHLRPWTVLVRRSGKVEAAFSVTGWRTSRRLIAELKARELPGEHHSTLL